MKTKEVSKQVRDKVVEKYKSGLGYKKIPIFHEPLEHHQIHYHQTERIWYQRKPAKRGIAHQTLSLVPEGINLRDERDTFRYLEGVPNDEPDLCKSTILFLISWLISLAFSMMLRKEAVCFSSSIFAKCFYGASYGAIINLYAALYGANISMEHLMLTIYNEVVEIQSTGFGASGAWKKTLPPVLICIPPPPMHDLSALDVPAELASVLNSAQARSQAEGEGITEVSPPQVKTKCVLSLPPDINNYPFSIFIRSYFKDYNLPPLGQPLQNPLTRLSQNDNGVALELYKLVLHFVGNTTMNPWQQRIIGNYIVERCLRQPSITDEVLCQAATLTVQNNNEEQNNRVWLLLSSLLSCLIPSPTLEKPLLKYVSDQGSEGYKAICQSKMLRAKQKDLSTVRSHAPTLLEWTANERKGKMVVDIYTYNEEKYTAEVDSWTTAEQLSGWLLQSRGAGDNSRGWSISVLDGNQWLDLCGNDLILDVIAEVEDGVPTQPFPASDYPFGDNGTIPEPPPNFAPQLPPGHPTFSAPGFPSPPPPPPPPPPVPPPFDEMERSENLSRRMKGGGGIGPTRQNAFGSPGMNSMPQYSMPMMNGMMPAMGNMQMMPNMPAMMPQAMMPQMMPQAMPMAQPMMPSVDPAQLAAQQQAFIQQQALLLAQQMTLQATVLSQQQQQQQELPRNNRPHSPPPKTVFKSAPKPVLAPKPSAAPVPPPAPPAAPAPSPAPIPPPAPKSVPNPPPVPSPKSSPSPQEPKPQLQKPQTPVEVYWDEEEESEYISQKKTFQQKREFFQKMVRDGTRVKSLKPPSKILLPAQIIASESESDEEPPEPPEPEPQPEIPTPKPPPIVPPPVTKTTEAPEKETKKPGGVIKQVPRPKPSQEIKEIIKMYQSRPQEEPKPYEPVRRTTQNFLKKKDPKQEALERLGNAGPPKNTPDSPAAPPPPPPPAEKSSGKTSSIREKQKPLLGLFQSGLFPPTVQTPKSPVSVRTLEGDHSTKSSISKHTASVFFSYSDVNWKLYVRKEIFYPKEKFTHPYYLNLLCEQIIRDTYSDNCFKLSREERRKMKDFLSRKWCQFNIGRVHQETVSLDDDRDQLIIGVSHRGFRLLKEVNATGIQQRHLKTLCSYSFADILAIEKLDFRTLHFSLRNEDLQVHSKNAQALKALLETFLQELVKDSNHVVALQSHITDDKSLLQFKKGDIIKVLPMDGHEPGWLFGSLGGRTGLFPFRYVQAAAAPDYHSVEKRDNWENKSQPRGLQRTVSKESNPVIEASVRTASSSPLPVEDSHYTMVEFALKYFREAQSMLGWKGMAAEGKKAVELVQHTKVPIQESLILLADRELSQLATNNFMTLMRLMRDQQYREPDDVKCVYEILVLCREQPLLKDEIYCQVLKQITENPKSFFLLLTFLLTTFKITLVIYIYRLTEKIPHEYRVSDHYSNEYVAPPLWEVEPHIHYCNERYHVTAQYRKNLQRWKKQGRPGTAPAVGQSVQKIGKTLKVSPSAVAKTINRYKETGLHEDRPRKGRPRVTSAAEDKFIRVTSLRNRRLTAAQIRDQINATQSSSSKHISTTTVKRKLCAAGLHGKIAATKPLLRTGNKQKRLFWAKEYKEWTLDQ
ncbi:unnamed protein product [Ranitomeya imitator]|uniref:Uncharacterized protein n=1 Tax=Ranitomeya imitator TaxID=111125 RepID=A0ABN9M467_9NEOB|nr:unnamed protein product [Ranitomeya imitator]